MIPITLNLKGKLYNLTSEPIVMGIMNTTPDSFYSGSRTALREESILAKAEQMILEGASILDIGGYSTRPGASPVSEEEEWKRVEPALKALEREYPTLPLSVDTFRAGVAQRAVEKYGAAIINDVSGGTLDGNMFDTMAKLQVPYILMHMRGTPSTMSSFTQYEDVTLDVIRDLETKRHQLRSLGFQADIIMDPGFGFSKNIAQNYEMLHNLRWFEVFNAPLLVGISRKKMIWELLEISPEDALNGTTILNTAALLNGAHILRVHDVRAAKEAVRIVQAIVNPTNLTSRL